MDTKQMEYILKIAEENNITKAAEKLFITQSALNQQLLKLEKELGTPLFHRSRTNWHLTEAGRIYVDGVRSILQIKNSTYNHIYDITNAKKGTLTLGLTPGRGLRMFTALYPELHKKFPTLDVHPLEMRVRTQQEALSQGEIDLGLMTLPPYEPINTAYEHLKNEELILILPASHPLAVHAAAPGEPFPVMDLKQLQDEPFVLMEKASPLRSLCNELFEEAGFTPNILFETNNTSSIVTMVQSTLCCGIIPRYYTIGISDEVACFSLPGHPFWNIVICWQKNGYLNAGAKEFIRLTKKYWDDFYAV